MIKRSLILATLFIFARVDSISQQKDNLSFQFLGNVLTIDNNPFNGLKYSSTLSLSSMHDFYDQLNAADYQPIINKLLDHKNNQGLDDWLYYQLIRKTAQQLSPKAENYFSYTLYKWFLLTKSGYDAILRISNDKMLFYVQSDEVIYNIPFTYQRDKQYVCLNYHDYSFSIDFQNERFWNVEFNIPGEKRSFTYKVNRLPEIRLDDYIDKQIGFNYSQQQYLFTLKVNPEIKNLFTNYPAADYSNQFAIPLSKQTYNSLIPQLKDVVRPMTVLNGVDYLMHFTRYAFLFEKDTVIFGREKRLSAEETLLYDQSDCEDRAALFFYLVKEIYNLPMIVLAYPNHVSVAIKFDKRVGKPIVYNGTSYYVCDPTPQKKDLQLGQVLPQLKNETFEVAYTHNPRID